MFGTFVADDPAITLDGQRGPQVPFENVFLHGLIRDEFGRKMSKSKGNGIDPLDWVEYFGADALRFTLARGASPGGDLSIGEDHARASRNFATKLFNATRFALMNGASPATAARRRRTHRCRPLDPRPAGRGSRRSGFGVRQLRVQPGLRVALSLRLGRVLRLVPRAGQSATGGSGSRHTNAVLAAVLDALLKLLHPVMPFVTETLWKTLTGGESLVIADWPQPSGFALDAVAAQRVADMQKLVTEVRRFRSDQGLNDRQRVPARLSEIAAADLDARFRRSAALAWLTGPAMASARRRRSRCGCRAARSSSNSTRRAPSTSPPSGAGWRRTWPPRRRSWPDRRQARQRGVPGQGARGRRRQDPRPPAAGPRRGGAHHGRLAGLSNAQDESDRPPDARTRSQRCCRSSICSTSAGRRRSSNPARRASPH